MLDCQLAFSRFFNSTDYLTLSDPVFFYEQTPSTQDAIKKLLSENSIVSATVFSYKQTKGRGRNGSVWHTFPGDHLFFSHAVLMQHHQPKQLSCVGLVVGLILRDYLENNYQVRSKVKWPNDLYIEDKKLSGILCETFTIDNKLYCIIGIGINISNDASIKNETSVEFPAAFAQNYSNKSIHRWELLGRLTPIINHALKNLDQFTLNLSEIFNAHDYLLEKNITVETGSATFRGTACGINSDGALLLKNAQGQTISIYSGHIILDCSL